MSTARQASHLIFLNFLRGLSIISSIFLLVFSLVMIIRGFPHLTTSKETVFQEMVYTLFFLPFAVLFLLSDFGIATETILEPMMPGLGPNHGLFPLGMMQVIAAASLLSQTGHGLQSEEDLDTSAYVFVIFAGWFVLVIGVINGIAGGCYGKKSKELRKISRSKNTQLPISPKLPNSPNLPNSPAKSISISEKIDPPAYNQA